MIRDAAMWLSVISEFQEEVETCLEIVLEIEVNEVREMEDGRESCSKNQIMGLERWWKS